jgi:hypothetical protein
MRFRAASSVGADQMAEPDDPYCVTPALLTPRALSGRVIM